MSPRIYLDDAKGEYSGVRQIDDEPHDHSDNGHHVHVGNDGNDGGGGGEEDHGVADEKALDTSQSDRLLIDSSEAPLVSLPHAHRSDDRGVAGPGGARETTRHVWVAMMFVTFALYECMKGLQPVTSPQTGTHLAGITPRLSPEPSTDTSSPSDCKKSFGTLRFLEPEEERDPPALYASPGSGNAHVRHLIEYATGVYTGSVYGDQSLISTLPGEPFCNRKVVVVDAHPLTLPNTSFLYNGFDSGDADTHTDVCVGGGVRQFRRFLVLLRDPYDVIWGETVKVMTGAHDGNISNATSLRHVTAQLATTADQYCEMWEQHYTFIQQNVSQDDVLWVRFEDLTHPDTRFDTLKSVLGFLHFPADHGRLECALTLAEETPNNKSPGSPNDRISFTGKKGVDSEDHHEQQPTNHDTESAVGQQGVGASHPMTDGGENTRKNVEDSQQNAVGGEKNTAQTAVRYWTKADVFTEQMVFDTWARIGLQASKFGYKPYVAQRRRVHSGG